MKTEIFDEKKYRKLNDPSRLDDLPPEFFKRAIGSHDVKVIVDIGAGTGFFSKEFAKLYPGSMVYAADISDYMITYIKEHVESAHPDVKAMKMTDSDVPLTDASADLIVMINVHHEIPDHDRMLTECRRLLKKNGKILISDWKKQETGKGPSMENRFEPDTVAAQLIQNGFDLLLVDETLKNNFLIIASKI